ncbi:MAG: FAD-binding protein, partial [Gemmatimonadota bacterium]
MRWEADVRLAEHTRYRIGGPTPGLGHAEGRTALVEALAGLGGAPYRVLGRGANLLVSDRGVAERVLVLAGEFGGLRVGGDHIEAGGAAGLPALVGEARRAAFAGWSFLEAVPGSVGGGLRMNAGSEEVGLWDRVEWVEAITPDGDTVRLTASEARPGYRTVGVPESWIFVGGRFAATAGHAEDVETEHFERRRTKVETQVYD